MALRTKLFSLCVAVLVALTLIVPAQAQEGTPGSTGWGDFFDADGVLKPGVTQTEVSRPADWMPSINILGQWGVEMQATYNVYTAPDGATAMTPSASTLLFMAMNPQESGLANANGEVALGAGAALQAFGSVLGGNITAQQLVSDVIQQVGGAALSYVDANHFADAIISGNGNAWSFLGGANSDTWHIFEQLMRSSTQQGNLYLVALIYDSCAKAPGGCPPQLCQSSPTACGLPAPVVPEVLPPGVEPPPLPTAPPSCPGPSVSQTTPTSSIEKGGPNFPLVVGQDPEQRGADVEASVNIPNVIYTWHEPIFEPETVCQGGKKGVPQTCQVIQVFKGCRAHRESLPERVTNARATATLTDTSRDWIIHELGATWYGAYIHQDSFNLKQYGHPTAGCGGNSCSFTLSATKVPFADPGYFDLKVQVNTAGTFFNGRMITKPRVLGGSGKLRTWVILPTLIDASTSGMPLPQPNP
jgi:hypothetical protein